MQNAPLPRTYAGRTLERVAFPLGGIGAGSVCLEGNGGLTAWSLRNQPSVFTDLPFLAALSVDGAPARVLQGPVPRWKAHHPWGTGFKGTGAEAVAGRRTRRQPGPLIAVGSVPA